MAERISFLHKNKPNSPDQELLDWIGFLLKAGPVTELTSLSANYSLFTLLHLDLLFVSLLTFFGAWVVARSIVTYFKTEK